MAISRKTSKLRVGRLSFCNVMPFFWKIFDLDGEYVFIDGVPSELNQMLRREEIDFAPSSSIEYAHNSQSLILHPGLCIAGKTTVQSVLLFSDFSIDQLDRKKVALSASSDTSVALLSVLCKCRYGIEPLFEVKKEGVVYSAELIIGDAALESVSSHKSAHVIDLAQEWFEWTGLPFVFALWIARRDVVENPESAKKIQAFSNQIAKSLEMFDGNFDEAIQVWRALFPVTLSDSTLKKYFTCMEYRYSAIHEESLTLFYSYCVEIGLLASAPKLDYFVI